MNYIQQAYKGKLETWMVILTTIIVSGVFVLNFIVYLFASPEQMDASYDMMKQWDSNLMLILNLGLFVPLILLLFVFVKYVHQRSIVSLTTSRKKVDFGRVLFSFFMIVIFTVGTFAIGYYYDSSDIVMQFNPGRFAVLFIICVLLFPFQIGLEEYLFRGYLMQHIGVIVKNRWFPLILTSVLFGIMHSANPEVAEIGYFKMMIFYVGTGLLLGIMTLMDEGLELALGFHFGNNLMAALLITSDWSALQTDAIFKNTAEQGISSITEIIAPVLIVYPIMLLILSKKYGWTNWKERLFGSVTPPPKEDYKVLD